jgi:hypothetical protein
MDATAFHPSLWGDFFVKYKPPTAPKVIIKTLTDERHITLIYR